MAVKKNYTIYYDEEYNLLKRSLKSKASISRLSTVQKDLIRRKHLKLRKVNLLDKQSLQYESRQPVDESSVSKEIISLQIPKRKKPKKPKKNKKIVNNDSSVMVHQKKAQDMLGWSRKKVKFFGLRKWPNKCPAGP